MFYIILIVAMTSKTEYRKDHIIVNAKCTHFELYCILSAKKYFIVSHKNYSRYIRQEQ